MDILQQLERLKPDLLRIDRVLKERAAEPNVFGIFSRVLGAEGLHSDILRWLLSPREWHGLGDGFAVELLHRWWERNRHGEPRSDLRWPATITVKNVVTEVPTGRGPIDLVLEGAWGDRSFVLGIENKVGAVEGRETDGEQTIGQVNRYAGALVRQNPKVTTIVALLTPEGRSPLEQPGVPWAALSYGDVAAALEAALETDNGIAANAPSAPAVGRKVARDYLSIVRRHIMGQDPELTELCWKLYKEHPEAWREIRKRLPSELDDWLRLLGRACCLLFTEELGGEWASAVRADYYAVVFRPSWFVFGNWRGSQLVKFEKDEPSPVIPAVHLRLALEIERSEETQMPPILAVRLKSDVREVVDRLRDSLLSELGALFPAELNRMGKGQFTLGIGKRQVKRLAPVQEVDDRVAAVAAQAALHKDFGKVPLSKVVDAIDRSAQAVAEV